MGWGAETGVNLGMQGRMWRAETGVNLVVK